MQKGCILFILLFLTSYVFGQDTISGRVNFAQNAEAFSKGIENKYKEDYDMAIMYFEEALKAFPEDHASMYELSVLYGIKGMEEKGFDMIKNAVALDSTNKWYKIRLADFHQINNDYDSFIKVYDELLKEEPNNLEYLEVYIDALLQVERYEEVTEKLDVYEENIGVSEYISLQKIDIYNYLGKKEKIIEELEKLVETYPYEMRYKSMLAEAYVQNDREDDAYDLYLEIKEFNPDDPYINTSLMEYYQKKGELDKAFEEFILVIKNKNLDYNTKVQIHEYWFGNKELGDNFNMEAEIAGKAFVETYPDKDLGYYVLGTSNYLNENYVEAQRLYLEAIARDSSSYGSWYQLVLTDIELDDTETTYEHSTKALQFYPEQPIFYLINGAALAIKGEYEEAIKIFEKGKFLSADKALTAEFDSSIADLYHELGDKEKMFQQYDKVLRNDPENLYVLNNYAYFLSEENIRLEDALKMSAITIEKEPKNVTFLDTYAWILYKLGRYKEAKKWLEKVFSYDENPDGVNYEHYGDILYKLGETKDAVKNWKKAKKLGNASELIDKKIKDEKLYE